MVDFRRRLASKPVAVVTLKKSPACLALAGPRSVASEEATFQADDVLCYVPIEPPFFFSASLKISDHLDVVVLLQADTVVATGRDHAPNASLGG